MNRSLSEKAGCGKRHPVFRPSGMRRWLFGLAAVGLFFSAARASETAETLETIRTATEKWVETQRILSKEKRDFALAKELLAERIALLEREIESVENKIREADASIAEADRKRDEMLEEKERLLDASSVLKKLVSRMEERVCALLERLPEPLRQHVKPLSQRIAAKSDSSRQSLSERFQNVVGILNEVDKFHKEITAVSEIRTLPDGTSQEVAAVYVGISCGYFSNPAQTAGGFGFPDENRWNWTVKPEIAGSVSDLIAILKNEKTASYVLLPLTIQ
ncbi:MAG: DUF3450 family protein [Anaerohalosphaeraceae bacterium]